LIAVQMISLIKILTVQAVLGQGNEV
jgi:hypothetical protein